MPASIQASAISHIALCVRDLERSLQFYRDGLGFQVTKDEVQDTSRGGLPHLYHDRHGQRRVVHLRYGDAQSVPFLVLTEHPGDTVSGTPIMLDQVGISHVSFTVPNVDEVTQRLLAHGAKTCGPADAFRDARGHIRTVFSSTLMASWCSSMKAEKASVKKAANHARTDAFSPRNSES